MIKFHQELQSLLAVFDITVIRQNFWIKFDVFKKLFWHQFALSYLIPESREKTLISSCRFKLPMENRNIYSGFGTERSLRIISSMNCIDTAEPIRRRSFYFFIYSRKRFLTILFLTDQERKKLLSTADCLISIIHALSILLDNFPLRNILVTLSQ